MSLQLRSILVICFVWFLFAATCQDLIAAQLQLGWTDNATNEDGFKIERGPASVGPFSQVAVVGPNVNSYQDSGLPDGTTFCYRVRAYNTAGESEYSNVACKNTGQIVFTSGHGSAADRFIVGGVELNGLSRGPAFQLIDMAGNLLTQFVLNPDFTADINFTMGNLDGDPEDEILVGGRETQGLARGPAFQIYDSDGSLRTTAFVLNPDFTDVTFSIVDVTSPGVLVCGRETSGLARGPAFQIIDSFGALKVTRFTLNTDITADYQCLGSNYNSGIPGDEVLVGGRENHGLARGPLFEIFDSNGNYLSGRFVLNADFTDVSFIKIDINNDGINEILVLGTETQGLARGPAFQIFDGNGNYLSGAFVLNADFSQLQAFAANTTHTAGGNEIVVGGMESTGLAQGPAFQIFDSNGNYLSGRFVLNADFTDVSFTKIDINNDEVDEILVVGRETRGLAQGPAFQIFDGDGNYLSGAFVLNPDFAQLRVFVLDHDGNGIKEIGIGGVEVTGLQRGPAYEIWNTDGTYEMGQFVLNPDF